MIVRAYDQQPPGPGTRGRCRPGGRSPPTARPHRPVSTVGADGPGTACCRHEPPHAPVPGGRYPEGVAMGIFSMLRRDDAARSTAREAMREARRGADAPQGGALERAVTMIRDIGLDGKLAYSSAAEIARHAQR